jgi:hypothetical protein
VVVIVRFVAVMTRRMIVSRPLGRESVLVVGASRVAVRMCVAGAALGMTVSVAAGPVPVLAHIGRIRRLAVADQRVKPNPIRVPA